MLLTISLCSATQSKPSTQASTSHLSDFRQKITIPAQSHIVINADHGQILSEHRSEQPRPPASLTKLMTLYVTFDLLKQGKIHIEDKIIVSKQAVKADGFKINLAINEEIKLETVIDAIATASANDASVALAEHISGSEASFSKLMNETAERLGMHASHFVNASGLPHKNHTSTAKDLAILSRRIIRDFPERANTFNHKWFTHKQVKQFNRNRLLWRDPDVTGLKTGHTEEAGYCIAASASKQNNLIIAVTLGSQTDKDRTHAISDSLHMAQLQFKHINVSKLETTLTVPVQYGVENSVKAELEKPLALSIPKAVLPKATIRHNLIKQVQAPVNQGTHLGYLTIIVNGKPVTSVKLIAEKDIAAKGFLAQLIEWLYNLV